MIIEEIFTKLAQHMEEGIAFHKTLAQAYDFIGLCGFAKCHIYHWIEETKGYECLLHYYSTHYHKLLNITPAAKTDIIPATWYKYSTMDVDINTKRQSTKDLMTKWIEWEKQTKTLYTQMYKELCDLNEIAAADKIKCYILDVTDELKHAEKKYIKLESIDYSINTIISWQQPMYRKFKKQLEHLYD